MTRSITKSLMFTAAAATAVTLATAFAPGIATEAEAKKIVVVKGHHHHMFHRHHYFVPRVAFVHTGYVSGCHYLKRRAHITGNPYWFERYRACLGY